MLANVIASSHHSVMKKLVWLSQKGGSGKTTLAVHTAVAALDDRLDVLIVDTDPQQSATVWGKARSAKAPLIATIATSDLERVMVAAETEDIDLIIVDTAPHAAPEAARIARAADLVLIPCRPTAFDLAAAEGAAMIVKAAKVKAAFVLSACPVRAPEIAETRRALDQYGLPVAPIEVTERRAFSRAIASGRAVTEFESDGRAAGEIRALWKWIRTEL
jgi:chromosome partitioning protein